MKRHGDIPLHPITEEEYNLLAKESKKISVDKKYTIAEGETVGHFHVVNVNTKEALEVLECAKGIIMKASRDCVLTHPEHGKDSKMTLTKGHYRVGKERTYDWFGLYTKQVID